MPIRTTGGLSTEVPPAYILSIQHTPRARVPLLLLFVALVSRRHFLAALPLLAGGAVARLSLPAWSRDVHPTPRPGVNASKVLRSAALDGRKEVIEAFDLVRQIPQVVDGIRCYCGCAELPESYSLLSCFEGDGMASHCAVCQGEARLAFRLHRAGRTLDEIRAAIDERYA